MITAKKMLILDLDGTLINTEARFNECQKISAGNKRLFWDCFQSPRYMHLDTPNNNVVSFAKSLIDSDTVVIIISGRSEVQREKTVEQLNQIGIKPHEIYLRKPGNFKKDFEYKTEIVEQLLQKYSVNEIILIDDSNDVLSHISSKFPQIKVIDAKTL